MRLNTPCLGLTQRLQMFTVSRILLAFSGAYDTKHSICITSHVTSEDESQRAGQVIPGFYRTRRMTAEFKRDRL
jgi:hypothetical protein